MINANMRDYLYFTLGAVDAYGQEQISSMPQGTINMAIYIVSQNLVDNINYQNATYVGLTMDKSVNDSYIIQNGNEKLKVLYVNPMGRFNQVFLGHYDWSEATFTIDGGLV